MAFDDQERLAEMLPKLNIECCKAREAVLKVEKKKWRRGRTGGEDEERNKKKRDLPVLDSGTPIT